MISGFSVAVGFLFWAAIMFYSPKYFRVSSNPYAALALGGVGALCLMIAVAGMGTELSSPRIGHYFTVLVSEGPSSIPWAVPSSAFWENAGIAGAFLVGMGFFHVAAAVLGRWRILEVLLKMLVLLFAGLAALFLAGVVDALTLKPLLIVPANRLASGQQTIPADPSGPPRGNEPSDGSGTPLESIFNAVIALGTLISTISALAAGWGYVVVRTRNILRLVRR